MNETKHRKVLHIVEAFGGGVYTFLVPLMNATCEEFDTTIAYALRPQTPKDYKNQIDSKIHLIEGKNFVRSLSPIKDIKTFFEIKKIVKDVKPDVIHLHSSKSGFIGRMAINCKKNTVFYTPHGYAFLKLDDTPLKRKIYYFIEKIAALTHCTTIAVSKGEYEIALKLSKRALFINNGINIDINSPMPNMVNTQKPLICTVGRICYQKNPWVFNQVAKNLPDINFMWIGDGEMRDTITAPNITVTGWIPRDEAIEKLNTADIFLLPSLWEGLPISLLEAMYAGKPAIVSPVIGNKDVIRHGANGFFASTPLEYITIINNIINGKYDIEKIVSTAYNEILKEYNTSVMSSKYAILYRNKGVNDE
ncbi:MAG: glycosyltransferase family 4 protein [Lachnospiraceae bacterium]|nr:glycosyltransferase family 4 protein [Lachnospiraceae bacterium]